MSMTSLRAVPARPRVLKADRNKPGRPDSLARFLPLVASVPDPMLLVAPDGCVAHRNEASKALFQRPAVGSALCETQAWRENERKLAHLISELVSSADTNVEGRRIMLTRPSTLAPIPVEGRAGALVDRRDRKIGWVVLLHDRSEAVENRRLFDRLQSTHTELEERIVLATAALVERNEQLQRQHLVLEQAASAKTRFLASVSHELRTPLNAILGYAALMRQGVTGEVPPHLQRPLGKVEANARQLLGVVNDVLDLSRIEEGRLALRVTEFDLGALVDELLGELEPLVARSGLTVAQRLPALAPLRTDRQKLKQALQNLVVNALKFTSTGGVTVSARAVGDRHVEVDVVDTGIGIAEEHLARIFEAFEQVDGVPTRTQAGTGLGLALVRRLAEALGGTVRVQSRPGAGSTFTLTLPMERRRS
ncbi:MAG: hypothetical protein RL199_945 [Pseudomonadota bacterium]|jgi:signal transduction histidine kinase